MKYLKLFEDMDFSEFSDFDYFDIFSKFDDRTEVDMEKFKDLVNKYAAKKNGNGPIRVDFDGDYNEFITSVLNKIFLGKTVTFESFDFDDVNTGSTTGIVKGVSWQLYVKDSIDYFELDIDGQAAHSQWYDDDSPRFNIDEDHPVIIWEVGSETYKEFQKRKVQKQFDL